MDKFHLAGVGVCCLLSYGVAAMHYGYDGTIATTVIGGIVGIVAGTIGFVLGSRKG